MAIGDKLAVLNDEREQRNAAFRARALLQEARELIFKVDSEIQEIADSGSFDTIDTEIKQALIATWDVVKAAKTGFEDADIATLLDWST